jgi:hydroxysqualene synthase
MSNPLPSLKITKTLNGKNKNTENFPVASFFIRANLRPAIHCFYDFARAADDISDHPLMEPAEKVKQLNAFASSLKGKDDAIAVAKNLRDDLAARTITTRHALDLLVAFTRDAVRLRYQNWDELLEYCRYSANPVGRHVLALHDIGETAWPANDALCTALQIINHIQDCGDDYADLDRIYIPLDMAATREASLGDLSRPSLTPALRQTLNDMLDKTETLLTTARDLPRHIPDIRLKIETSIIAALAEDLVKILRMRDPLADPVKLSKIGKIKAVLKGILRAWQ